MKDAVNKQILNKEELNKFEIAGEEHVQGVRNVKADEFELMNNRKRLVHTQPFTDAQIKEAFFTFDVSGNGFVGASEIRFVLDALGENVTDEEIDEMIRMIDADGDG